MTQRRKLERFQKNIDRWVWNKEAIAVSGLRDPEFDHFNDHAAEDEMMDPAATRTVPA